MAEIYREMSREISSLINRTFPELSGAEPDADSGHAEFTAPLGYLTGLPAGDCAARLIEAAAQRPPLFMGEALLKGITHNGGHVCFQLSTGAYGAAMRRIIEGCPQPGLPEHTQGIVEYALARMLMLSRQGGQGCPEDERIQMALWLCLGIEGFGGKKREAMRLRAARALLDVMEGRGLREREALRRKLGAVGGCAARLLALPPDNR